MLQVENFRKKINSGRPAIGCHCKWGDSSLVEVMAMSGFDFVWFDGEHGAMNIETLQNHFRAVQGHGVSAIYRVPWNDPVLVKPILELGVDGIIFPFVNSAADAERAVKSCLYPPAGVRGFGPSRANGFGLMPMDEYFEETKKIFKIIQIEHIDAVNHIDEILAVEGIDGVVIGQFDLSGSVGLLSQITHPTMLELVDMVADKCRKAKIPFSTAMGGADPDVVKAWFKRGASFITLSSEMDFVREGSLGLLKLVNGLFDSL